jgi:SAM-dependent methyltransferase
MSKNISVTSKLQLLFKPFCEKNRRLDPFQSMDPRNGRMSGAYGYVPARGAAEVCIRQSQKLFYRLHGRKAKTFLDLGSGKGGVLFQAHELGLKATGVEYSQELVNLANELTQLIGFHKGRKAVKTIAGDILQWVPDTQYDIIYFFRPFYENKMWYEFIRHLMAVFPKNQVVASFFSMDTLPGFKPGQDSNRPDSKQLTSQRSLAWTLDKNFVNHHDLRLGAFGYKIKNINPNNVWSRYLTHDGRLVMTTRSGIRERTLITEKPLSFDWATMKYIGEARSII